LRIYNKGSNVVEFIAVLPTESFAYLVDRANSIVHEQLDQFMILSNPNKTSILYSGAVYRFGIVHNENILQNFDKYTIL
jgi:hypothetical protein